MVSGVGGEEGALSALIAEPVLADALALVATVESLGFRVTVADGFHAALARLRVPPDLLIADIRLGEYNGLHLVLRSTSANPDLAAIITSSTDDPVLRADAEQLGATFVVKPISPVELRAAIERTWERRRDPAAETIRPPFERRSGERRRSADVVRIDRRVSERRRGIGHGDESVASTR